MPRDVNYYLAEGLDETMARYFAAGRKKITHVSPNPDFTLTLDFENGERRVLDCKSFLREGTVFAPFLKYENFSRVYLDDLHCVCWDVDPTVDSEVHWNNKVDLSPDTCYVDSVPVDLS